MPHTNSPTPKTYLWCGEPAWYCPGCQMMHRIHVHTPSPANGAQWTWNGDHDKPTVSPSILVRHHGRCHSFLRDGVWQYLDDCTHDLAGQHVPLPELPHWILD